MKYSILWIILSFSLVSFGQNPLLAPRKNNHANQLFGKQKYKEALDIYLSLLEKQPDNSELAFNIANTYQALGEVEKAETFYEKARNAQSDETRLNAEFNTGLMDLKNQNIPSAVERFVSYLKKHPGDQDAKRNLELALKMQENQQKQDQQKQNQKGDDQNKKDQQNSKNDSRDQNGKKDDQQKQNNQDRNQQSDQQDQQNKNEDGQQDPKKSDQQENQDSKDQNQKNQSKDSQQDQKNQDPSQKEEKKDDSSKKNQDSQKKSPEKQPQDGKTGAEKKKSPGSPGEMSEDEALKERILNALKEQEAKQQKQFMLRKSRKGQRKSKDW